MAVLLLLVGSAPQQVTFEGARKLAEAQAPDVALARIRTAVSRAEVGIAGALANPTISVSSSTQSAKLGTGVSVPLPLFGQRGTSVFAAEADLNVAQLDVEVARREARHAATLAWVDLWEAQRRGDLLATAAKDAQRVFEVATEKFDVGIGAKVDVLRTRADWARAAAEAQAATHDVTAASARLTLVLGAEVPLIASGEPAYAALPRVDDAAGRPPHAVASPRGSVGRTGASDCGTPAALAGVEDEARRSSGPGHLDPGGR